MDYPEIDPSVALNGDHLVISVPISELIAVAENCPVQPARVTDRKVFAEYVAGFLEKKGQAQIAEEITSAVYGSMEEAAYMGAGIQLVLPPYEEYADSMWADTSGGMLEYRRGFWRADPWGCGPRSKHDCVVAAILAERAGERDRAVKWIKAGWPDNETALDHLQVEGVLDETLDYLIGEHGGEVE